MSSKYRIFPTTFLRLTAILAIALVLVLAETFTSSSDTVLAASKKYSVFGTVTSAPQNGQLDVATRHGTITLVIDDHTKIKGKHGKKKAKLKDVQAGMSVVGYYTEEDDGPVAKNLTFVARNTRNSFNHVIGVVLYWNGDSITVKTPEGEQVEFEIPEESEQADVEQGSMIAASLQQDEETGQLESTALVTAQATIEKLAEAIDNEIGIAQQQLLKVRMSETATVHLTRLYETLDEIRADTQAKIAAAYAKYQAAYDETLKATASEPVTLQVVGQITAASGTGVTVQSDTDATEWNLVVSNTTAINLADGTPGTLADIQPGQTVEVTVNAATADVGSIAIAINILPTPVPDANAPVNPSDDTITGTIVLVENGTSEIDTVLVVTQSDGSDSATSVTSDTVVSVNGEVVSAEDLEAGQVVEITLEDDGFSAREIQAIPNTNPDQTSTPTSVSVTTDSPGVSTVEYTLIGRLRALVDGGVVLDEVTLLMGDGMMTLDPSSIGQQVKLRAVLDGSGRWTVVGIQE